MANSPIRTQTTNVTEPPEILPVATTRVACDGGRLIDGRPAPDGALGHPRVFLEMGEMDRVECPYCDRLYIYQPAKAS
mgnify:CR=1 FL=1